jgi:hypothetical protein
LNHLVFSEILKLKFAVGEPVISAVLRVPRGWPVAGKPLFAFLLPSLTKTNKVDFGYSENFAE